MIDNVIFGDNQFFGINHMSEEKARNLSEKFSDLKTITDIIEIAYDSGIKSFMINSNERARDICDYLRANSYRYPDLCLYPSMPYAHKYANMVAEKGIFATLKETILADFSMGNIIGMITKGGGSLFEKDMIKVMQLLVDIEMKIFRDLTLKVVFLQNIVSDLLLGFGLKDFFIAFDSYIRKKYHAEAGFVTMNMPKMVEFLTDCGIENPIVCSSVNKAGFLMNPDIKSYEAMLKNKKFRPVAMSILASGAVPPEEAVKYVCQHNSIRSVVFGASSRQHIIETKNLIERYCQF